MSHEMSQKEYHEGIRMFAFLNAKSDFTRLQDPKLFKKYATRYHEGRRSRAGQELFDTALVGARQFGNSARSLRHMRTNQAVNEQ